ncbi:MAG TPA: RNA-binding domain-containing protein [Thermoplasmata archaeon]|nr:RNA-binding domain-containing protein [Thermoplasmata archaeon]
MASLPIHWIVARAFCHATEEESRVALALETAVPKGATTRRALEGEHGNPLVILTRRVDAPADVRAVWSQWSEAGLVAALRNAVDSRVDDDGILHLRIDKQKAFQGMLVPAREADTIDVQVKLKAYPAKPEEIRRIATLLVSEEV